MEDERGKIETSCSMKPRDGLSIRTNTARLLKHRRMILELLLAPFSGVQGIGVMKVAAETKGDAIALALEALASPEVGIALAKAGGCAPANSLSYDDPDVAADEIIAAIERTADTAQPMPNAAEMNVMWGPVDSMLAAVNKNGQDAASAAEEAQAAALQAIADMQ